MSTLIISSQKDLASTNIKKFLLEMGNWKKIGKIFSQYVYINDDINATIVTIDDELIKHENVDKDIREGFGINFERIIFISKHKSESGEPTLTVHPIGNFGRAEYGGKDRTLVLSSPKMMTETLRLLKGFAEEIGLYHRVSFEVTHHGPYVDVPSFFVEVGSTEKEWSNVKPAKVVAMAVYGVLSRYRSEDDFCGDIPVLIGIGGGHYAPRFTEMVFEKKVAFGHMIPTYHIEDTSVDEKIVEKCISATPGLSGVYLHRKSLKKSVVKEIEKIFDKMNIKIFRSSDLSPLF